MAWQSNVNARRGQHESHSSKIRQSGPFPPNDWPQCVVSRCPDSMQREDNREKQCSLHGRIFFQKYHMLILIIILGGQKFTYIWKLLEDFFCEVRRKKNVLS